MVDAVGAVLVAGLLIGVVAQAAMSAVLTNASPTRGINSYPPAIVSATRACLRAA